MDYKIYISLEKLSVALIGIAMGGIILYNLNPNLYWFMPKCPFKIITGLSCPGCGIQRAIYSLLHGNIVDAIQYNYYLLYAGPYAMLFVVKWLLPNGNARNKLKNVIENKYVVNFYVVTFLLWLVTRNLLNI